jgi:hypothetical protein
MDSEVIELWLERARAVVTETSSDYDLREYRMVIARFGNRGFSPSLIPTLRSATEFHGVGLE